MHQQVSVIRFTPKASSTAISPLARACSFTARPRVSTVWVPGWRWRPCSKRASAWHSVAEKCGLPRATKSTADSAELLSSRQHCCKSCRLTLKLCKGALPPSAVVASGASGVAPTIWNMGAALLVAKAAPKAFRSSLLSAAFCSPQSTGIWAPQSKPTW